MSIKEYLSSIKGEKELAVFSIDDPLPYIAETLLLPYLWFTR
jgi:predicted ATP-grasp superfamily ATP-dependent carboligase